MSFATKSDAIDARRKIPASDVKKLGWRGVMRDVQKSGRVVVTNHDAPEAVTRRTQSADACARRAYSMGLRAWKYRLAY